MRCRRLVDGFLKLINSEFMSDDDQPWQFRVRKPTGHGKVSQFLEIAVRNVVTAPIRHGIELYAMRKLHSSRVDELPELVLRLWGDPMLAALLFRALLGWVGKRLKLY